MSRSSDPGVFPGALLGGRYRLVRELAAGSMGAVWSALDVRGEEDAPGAAADREVAVKLLRPEFDFDPSIRRRFRREASILRSLSHPAIVRVLGVSEAESERSYTVMELLRGETLEALLDRLGPVEPTSVVAPLSVLCDGLEAVHQHGVVHGDIKPANLFWTTDDPCPVRIVDFGLSKIEGLERLTRTGELTGTPAYMAPELLKGGATLDGRIDQYALGVVLYQALAGQPPFTLRKHPGALVLDIVMGRGVPLEQTAPGVPAAVRAVIARAMAPRPEDRFASMSELGLAFQEACR